VPSEKKSVPILLLGGIIAVAVVLIGLYAWGEFHKGNPGIPDKEVKPGMYDFREEAKAGRLGRGTEPR
jgi:hypothetical protein